MAQNVVTLLLFFTYCSCMEMRETVERTVMVRTTGSDLEPDATGYIYKKESNGPARVTKMGESEVMEHFSKLYGKREAFDEPSHDTVLPFYGKNKDDVKDSAPLLKAPKLRASHASEKHIKPVVEAEQEEDLVDGLANEEFDKVLENYSKQVGDYKNDFANYLHGLGHYDHGIYHGYGYGRGLRDSKKNKEYEGLQKHEKNQHSEQGESEDNPREEPVGYSDFKSDGGLKEKYDDAYDHGKHYAHRFERYNDRNKDSDFKGPAVHRFQKVQNTDKHKKDEDFYDGDTLKGGYRKYSDGNRAYDPRSYAEGYHDAGYHGYFTKDNLFRDKESADEHEPRHSSHESEEPRHHRHRDFGIKGERDESRKGYGYKIEH